MDNAVQEKIGFPFTDIFGGTRKQYRVVTLKQLTNVIQNFIDTEIDLPVAVKATVIDQISPGEAFVILEEGLPKRLFPGLIHVWGRWLLRTAKEIDEYYEYPKK